MDKTQIKKMKEYKAKIKGLESDKYTQKVYNLSKSLGTSSNATSSGSSSSSASLSSGDGADKNYESFEMVLKSIQKEVTKKKDA